MQIKTLLKLANRFDKRGLHRYADAIDAAIKLLAQDVGGHISVSDLMKIKPSIADSLREAITFELSVEPDPDGQGSNVTAIPKIHDKWTDGLNLGDLEKTPGLKNYLINEPLDEAVKQVEEGKWFDESGEETEEIPFANEEDVDFTPEYKSQLKEIDDALSGAYEAWENEQILPGQERSPEVKQREVSDAAGGAIEKLEREDESGKSWFQSGDFGPDDKRRVAKKERAGIHKTEDDLRSLLVKIADDFDRSGKHVLAAEIDQALKSLSARPAAPMKRLDDDIKKSLIVFVHDADRNNSKAIKGLKELFRRLRYFDFADASKELGLDKLVKEMERTQDCLDGSKKKFYEIMHGKKPSRKDLDGLFADLAEELEEQPALDFFEEQLKKEEPPEDMEESLTQDEEEDIAEYLDEDEEELTEELEKELEDFLADLEDEEEDIYAEEEDEEENE